MRKILSALCATALAASFAVVGALPAASAPIYVPQTQPLQASDVVAVDFHRRIRRGDRRHSGFYKHNNHGYYNGHRGYRYKRHRDDYYRNGWWFPGGAFVAGAIIGGAIANSNNTYYRGGGNAHVQWCYDRYRSYRASDNTFQPYNGPRRQCYSPYS